jgi:LCP family protein required for cell wall assembly
MALRRTVFRAFSRRYLIALAVAAVLMSSAVVVTNYVISDTLSGVKRVHVRVALAPAGGANYLLLGSDTRAFVHNAQQQQAFGSQATDPNVNSDTMMVIHVEPGTRRTLIVSFPRDLWVNIPGRGMGKINSAFAAGPNLTIQTLKADFGIEINHFISVDFQSFQEVVNTIGQVPVYFPYAARDTKSGLAVLPGCIALNGSQALAYARSRTLEFFSSVNHDWELADPTADIGRIARQQQFIRELAAVAVQRSLQDPITTGRRVVNRVLKYLVFDQNLTKDDVLTLVDTFRTVNPNDTSHLEFQTMPWQPDPGPGSTPAPAGVSVLYVRSPNDQTIVARLRDFSGRDTSAPVSSVSPSGVRVRVVDSTGTSGLASTVLNDLVGRAGFRAGGTGQVASPAATTQVHYKPGSIAEGELLLQYLGPDTQLVADQSLRGVNVEVVLGRGFKSIVLPTGGGAVGSGQIAGTPAAQGPSAQYGGDTYANGNGGVNVAQFGPAAPKGQCR